MVRTDVLSHRRDEAPLGVHDLVAQVVPGLDEAVHDRIPSGRPARHRSADLAHERLHVADGIEHRPHAEQLQCADRLVVVLDRGGERLDIGRMGGLGGGILNYGEDSDLTLKQVTVTGNEVRKL